MPGTGPVCAMLNTSPRPIITRGPMQLTTTLPAANPSLHFQNLSHSQRRHSHARHSHTSHTQPASAFQEPNALQSAPNQNHSGPLTTSRRQVVLQGLSWPALAGLGFGALLEEKPPLEGSCPTCIGVVDGTLGSCSGVGPCMSSYDDRPGHFIAPWAHEERGSERALDKIEGAVAQVDHLEAGGITKERKPGYLYAVFKSRLGTDDVEFLLPPEDTTVELRASSRMAALPDLGRIEKRFEELRANCGFEVVTVLRNRQQILGVVESPWDTFGPTPPTDVDYNDIDSQ